MKMFINLIVAVLLLLPQGVAALCVQGDCVNGQGTVVLPDGRRYIGEFVDGIRSGRGLMTFPDGTKYLGDWQNDKPHGQGTLSAVGKFEYAGEFANGVREGTGTLETVDGKKYSGQWKNDVPHGQGKITYPDGAVFIGQFDNGKRNGRGEAIYSDGTKYIGQWKDDLPNGHGTKIFVDGVKYTGEFKNGLMHGRGTVVNPDGSSYTGEWQNEVLVKKEVVAAASEIAAAEEDEGHGTAGPDEMPAAAGEAATEEAPSVSAVDIINTKAGYASVNQNGAFVRTGPSTEYRIVRSVSRGFPVMLIGQQDNWSKIKDFVGQEGWISTPLLGLNNSVIVNVSRINIRSGPGLNYTVLSQIDFGTVLQLNNIRGDWYLVTMPDGTKGWLFRRLVWPAGHGVGSASIVSGAAAQKPREALPPAGDTSRSSQEKTVAEAGTALQVGAPDAGSEPAAEPSAAEAAPEKAPAAVTAIGEDVGTVTAESVAKPGTTPEFSNDQTYAGVARNDKGANIRSEPSLAAEVLRSVPPGFPLAVLERQGDWVLVEDFRERKGWVYASLLTDLRSVIIKVGKGNLRRGPSLIEEIVAQLDYGVVMFIDETKGDWFKVSNADGLEGWLHRYTVWPQ